MTYLSLNNVSYTYPNGFEAIKKVNLTVAKGEAVAIIGQNGAGKTTTAKLMNGLLKPTIGTVMINNEDTASFSTAKMSQFVGYVFQNPDDQIFQETIYKEIAFGPKNQKLSSDEMKQRVYEAAALCELTDVLEEHPYNLPYAKRKFITIAAVIAMNPTLLIFDEPTAGQDRQSTELLGKIIHALVAKNKSVLTITHDMEFVVAQFQRVIVFSDKQKQKEGTPTEIFWDESLLAQSHLKQPYISQLANALGYKNILTIDELLEVHQHETVVD